MLNPESLSKAFAEVEKRQNRALSLSLERRAQIRKITDKIDKNEAALKAVGASIAKVFFDEGDETIESLTEKSLALQNDKKEILASLGYPEDYLNVKPFCEKCSDTGRVNGKICECVKELTAKIDLAELNSYAPVSNSGFENFNLDYYKNITDENGKSIYEKQKKILNYLTAYSADFGAHSPNLFMFGRTGLGKTHLALASAATIIKKYFYVIYGTAGNIFADLEKEKFKDENGKYSLNKLINADLLIIDDLGAEFPSAFTKSAVHNIIESRLLAGKPMIITTNLDIDGINERYGERIASRIIGEYVPIHFDGKDVRQLKKFRY